MCADDSANYAAVSFTPSPEWGFLDSGPQSVQFYGQDTALLDNVSRFFGSALGADDASVVVATESHRIRLAERLKSRGLDVALAANQGRCVALDAAATLSRFTVGGQPDPARFPDVVGSAIQRAGFGEMVAIVWVDGLLDAAIGLEEPWNTVVPHQSFDILCAYPGSCFSRTGDAELPAKICAEHLRVIPSEGYTSLASEDERLRAITLLQQNAHALAAEVEIRKKAQAALRERDRELRDAVAAREVSFSQSRRTR